MNIETIKEIIGWILVAPLIIGIVVCVVVIVVMFAIEESGGLKNALISASIGGVWWLALWWAWR